MRLKKGPEIQDYVVETISAGGTVKTYQYFTLRSDARESVIKRLIAGADRVRTFRIKYELVADNKRKAKKGKR